MNRLILPWTRCFLMALALLGARSAWAKEYSCLHPWVPLLPGDVLYCPDDKSVMAVLTKGGKLQIRKGDRIVKEFQGKNKGDQHIFLALRPTGQLVMVQIEVDDPDGQHPTSTHVVIWNPKPNGNKEGSVVLLGPDGVLTVRGPKGETVWSSK